MLWRNMLLVAPIKALCSERYEDWKNKFGLVGLKSMELTGDSLLEDYMELQDVQIIITTPVSYSTRKKLAMCTTLCALMNVSRTMLLVS